MPQLHDPHAEFIERVKKERQTEERIPVTLGLGHLTRQEVQFLIARCLHTNMIIARSPEPDGELAAELNEEVRHLYDCLAKHDARTAVPTGKDDPESAKRPKVPAVRIKSKKTKRRVMRRRTAGEQKKVS